MDEFERSYYEIDLLWNSEPRENEKSRLMEIINNIPENVETILDVGCGNGILVNYLLTASSSFKRIYGIDRSKTALKFVNSEKSVGDIKNLPFKDNEFDLLICSEVIEHLPLETYEKAIFEIARVAKKYIIITVPYKEKLLKSHVECPSCNSKFHRDLHLRSFTEERMIDLIKDSFQNVKLLAIEKKYYFYLITPFKRMIKSILKREKQVHTVYCPICGYSELPLNQKPNLEGIKHLNKNKHPSLMKIWPKKIYYMWFLGLYQKK